MRDERGGEERQIERERDERGGEEGDRESR